MSQNSEPVDSYLPPDVPPPPPPPSMPLPPPGRKPKPEYETPLTWQEAWIKAVTEPYERSYQEIVSDPQASVSRAYTWIFAGASGAFVLQAISQAVLSNATFFSRETSTGTFSGTGIFCCLPFVGIVAVVLLTIVVGIEHLVAILLGGKGSFDDLIYGFSAFYAPLALISGALGLIPCIGAVLAIPVGLYNLFLNVLVVKTVHSLDWIRAIIAVCWWIILPCLCICCLALSGPSIGNVFQNIINQLTTPTP